MFGRAARRPIHLFSILGHRRRTAATVLVFVGLLLLVDRVCYLGFSQVFRRTDFLYAKVLARQPQLLFLGDSQSRHGIVPAETVAGTGLPSYNLARYGSGIVYTSGVYQFVRAHYRPQVLVVQVMALASERGAMHSLAPYFDESSVRQLLTHYPYRVRLKYALSKMLRYNSRILTSCYRLFREYDPHDGYVPLFGIAGNDRTRINPGGEVKLGGFQRLGEDLMEGLILDAHAAGIQVVFVEMPTLGSVRVDSSAQFQLLATRHHIPYLDFQEGGGINLALSHEHFRDAFHLNDEGARLFSKALGEQLASVLDLEPTATP